MNRKVVLIGIVGCVMLCCLATVVCGVVGLLSPSATPQPTPTASPTAGGIPSPTAEPTATPDMSQDLAYLECHIGVATVGKELAEDISFVFDLAAEDPEYLCIYLSDAEIHSRALLLEASARDCPQPDKPCLAEIRTLTIDGTRKIAMAMELYHEWCERQDLMDIEPILRGSEIFQEANISIQRTVLLFSGCVE